MNDLRKNEFFNPFNHNAIILDEIALEGLDGITWEALLSRLLDRNPAFLGNKAIDPQVEAFIWSVVKGLQSRGDIKVFAIKTPRKSLVIFDRYKYVDPDLGIIIEPNDIPEEIYPFKAIDGEEKGSCSDYDTRKVIRHLDSLPSFVQKHGGTNGFVLVASQKNRMRALLADDYDEVSFPLTSMQWCILERIGRARYLGEVSQGKLSLQFMNENPKTLFYHRKALITSGLITKQIHHQKSHGQNFQGTLFHLPRFYTERKSKALMLVHNMITFLKTKRHGMVSCEEMRAHLKLGHNIKKIYKSQDFLKYMRGSFVVPFRTLYPLSNDWRCKNSINKEKTVRVLQLLDMDIDPESIWLDKKEEEEDEEEGCFFKDQSSILYDRSMMHQAYTLLEKSGPEGIYQCELGRRLGLGKLESRTVCRNMERRGLVKTVIKDSGRQRITYFIASKFNHLSKASKKLKAEKDKMASFIESSKSDAPISPLKDPLAPSITELPNPSPLNVEVKEKIMPINTQVFDSPVLTSSATKGLKQGDNASIRQLSRANTIMETVRELKVVDDTTKLHKLILQREEAEGLKTRMDKKSLLRILGKLEDDQQIRNIKVVLQNETKKRVLHFVCHPDIDETNSVIQSAIEQAKMKFSITPKHSEGFVFRTSRTAVSSKVFSDGKLVYNPRIGKTYGLQPKFIRMREFHVFLYYLTYGYSGELVEDKAGLFKEWEESHALDLDEELREELQDVSIYSRSINWNMFIPQLPKHQGWSSGWCLMCDVLLRLPLSYFVKLVNVTYIIPGIDKYLSHPVKQHYLIQFLPHEMQKKLLFHRKYIFSCYEIATRLAYIGVVQFGPHKLKEKDQFFLYINKKGMLLDTTNSTPAYHKVDPNKVYSKKKFVFHSLDDVERYWYRMWEICIYTPLGISSSSFGQEITLEIVDKKEELIACLSPRECDEAVERDIGYLPGDQCGGAGLDSSMFSHLKRSWSWSSACETNKASPRRRNQVKTSSLPLPKRESIRTSVVPNAKAASRNLKRKKKGVSSSTAMPAPPLSSKAPPKSAVRTRIIAKRAKKFERKPYYDDVDKAALRLMRKLRVDWTNVEDSLLLLCKVAGSYLCQNTRYQMVQYTAVRDLLHKRFPESLNKTSRACQRRLNYMLKNSTTADNVSLFLSDVQQDPLVAERFQVTDADKGDDEQRLKTNFEPLVSMLVAKYQSIDATDENSPSLNNMIPDTMEELVSKYKFVYPQNKNGVHFQEPKCANDIKELMINTLITSSLCSTSDKNSWAFQLYKIYQQYPDWMLRKVMNKLRTDKMVSLKKQCNRSRLKMGNYLPLSSSPYQLSVTFSHIFLSRYQHEIYHQSWEFIKKVMEFQNMNPKEFMEVVLNHEGGFSASVAGLSALIALRFQIEVPDQLVVIDPNMTGVDDAYARILRRYKELLRNSGSKEIESDVVSGGLKPSAPKKPKLSDLKTLKSSEPFSKDKKGVLRKCVNLENSDIIFKESPVSESSSVNSEERSSQLVARSASRIALHIMKEESRENSSSNGENNGSRSIQHSHDFFVISSCRIFVNYLGLGKPETSKTFKFFESNKGTQVEVSRAFLPADIEAHEGILNRHGLDVYGKFNLGVAKLRKTCIPGDKTFYKDIPPNTFTSDIYNFVQGTEELGVTGSELMDKFPDDETSLASTVASMIESFLILRTGCLQTRYVCVEYGSPWLLHSFKMLRTKHKEAAPQIKTSKKLFYVEPEGEDDSKNEISEAVKKVDWSKVDQIHILLRPWIKIDGNLNRRVLDRLLGAVLGHVMLKPGMFMDKIQQKFSPALQPHHTRELLEMLAEIGAVYILKLKTSSPCSLFSSIGAMEKTEHNLLDESNQLIVEPVVDAIIKLGHFIGDRQYSQDFVCQCPCHPDKR